MKAKTRFYVFLMIVLIIAAVVCLLTLPMFHAQYIEIKNTDRRNEHIIKSIENLAVGKSIFLINRKQVKTEIEKDPYLVYKSVYYSLPNKIVVKVEERTPKYYINHLNNYLYLTSDGIVISAQKEKLTMSLPEIKGMAVNAFVVREKINIYDGYQLLELTNIMEKFIAVGFEHRISEIDIADVVNIKMKTNEGHQIIFGTSEKCERKIEWLYGILNSLANEKDKKYVIDVSAPENPTYKLITEGNVSNLQQ